MDSVWKARVYARRDGREQIAIKLTKTLCNVYRIALDTGNLTWKLKRATVTRYGQETTVPESSVIWTVGFMDIVWAIRVLVIWAGVANIVTLSYAT